MNPSPVLKPNAVLKLGPESNPIEIGNAKKLAIIAGPCQLESRSHAFDMAGALKEACTGYLQILALVDTRPWPEPVQTLVRRVFNEDLVAVERALSLGGDGSTWRDAVRDGGE